jgi:hypothetical protein
MNANATSRPISQQSANSWIPLLAPVLVAIALVIGVAGVAALTARSSTTSSTFVPVPISDHTTKDQALPPLTHVAPKVPSGYEWINGVAYPVGAPIVVPQSINSHEHPGLKTLPGVPYPGGLAGPSQVSLPGVPFAGGLAGPSQLDRVVAPGMGGH